MKRLVILALSLLPVTLEAFEIVSFELADQANGIHSLTWKTDPGYIYQVDFCDDLVQQNWNDMGFVELASGDPDDPMSFEAMAPNSEDIYYRVRRTLDTSGGEFLVLPTHLSDVDLVDGVCFSFDLQQVFSNLPQLDDAEIRIYKRLFGQDASWELIGRITGGGNGAIVEAQGLIIVRGSVVWIPEGSGTYEVMAEADDNNNPEDGVLETAARVVRVGDFNAPPTVEITSYPDQAEDVIELRAEVSDDDEVVRVEFYDNGILLGADIDPFTFALNKPGGVAVTEIMLGSPLLLRGGDHSFTAVAYDTRGGVTESEPVGPSYLMGNQRPTVDITSPNDGFVVEQGNDLIISYTAMDDGGVSSVTAIDWPLVFPPGPEFIGQSGTISIPTTGWTLGTHTIMIFATDGATEPVNSYPRFLRVVIDDGGQPFAEQLAANIVDAALSMDNASFTGVEPSSGEFQFQGGVNAKLDIDAGILLTTGAYELWDNDDIVLQTDADEYAFSLEGVFPQRMEPGDVLLEDRIVGHETWDAAVLEFDVTPLYTQLELEFQFASEEYLEFVSEDQSCWNDAFIVTVDGTIVSLLPDCSDIIGVHSIHSEIVNGCRNKDWVARNDHLYIDNNSSIGGSQELEYDGFTRRMRIHALVTADQTHTVRIAIADADDDAKDSGIFIQKDSVRSIAP